jgi:hypothetical protein
MHFIQKKEKKEITSKERRKKGSVTNYIPFRSWMVCTFCFLPVKLPFSPLLPSLKNIKPSSYKCRVGEANCEGFHRPVANLVLPEKVRKKNKERRRHESR